MIDFTQHRLRCSQTRPESRVEPIPHSQSPDLIGPAGHGRGARRRTLCAALSIAGPVILLTTRFNPVWLLAAGVMLGGLGLM